MIELELGEIARLTGARLDGDAQATARSVTTDSRRAEPGALFAAVAGEHVDGHDFVDDAHQRGAAAALVDRDVSASGPLLRVGSVPAALGALGAEVRRRVAPAAVAITGSLGKTTTKDLTAAALRAGRRVVAAEGSYNNELGVPLTLLELVEGDEALVAEIGARHRGDIAALAPLVAPDVAVVTAVAGVHLEVFGSIEAVAQAKGELVEALGADGVAVLNVDDERVAAMAARAPATIGYGLGPQADVRAEGVSLDALARASFTAVTPWGRAEVSLPLAGRHHVGNALAALAVAGHLGVDLEAAARALSSARISPWRGEVHELAGALVLNDAYNANPQATVAALDTLRSLEGDGRRWAVLGEMAEIGVTAEAEHEQVGAHAAAVGVDELVAVGAHAGALCRGAGSGATRARAVADAGEAAALLRAELGAGDVVLVKASRSAGLERVVESLADGEGRA